MFLIAKHGGVRSTKDGKYDLHCDEPRLTEIPVMILTASRDPHILRSLAPFQISDYHLKPLPPTDLVTRIRSLLDHRRRCARALDVSHRLERWNARRTQETVINH